ncbi:hypothetical protein P167DRAFT_579204 [Morchella conica CCBAS932]|uniref:Uncharacterized protein n=1 Tax=Morchella conica CCBAS932 TaxID=1392247 RepID=A0A3N4KP18_9PEZI|nr:hypothetical protein P167DRAFT_579204 [Morchella conica CCBAS932]
MSSTGNRSTRAVADSELGANTPAEIPGVDVVREGGEYQYLNLNIKLNLKEFEEEDFEDIEDGVEALYIEEYGKVEFEGAVSNCPNVQWVTIRCMILNQEDEGTMIAVQEFLAIAGQDLRADMLVKAVSEYWKSTQIDIKKDSELALLSSSLKEIEQHSTTPTLFRKKLSISSTTAKDWLHRLRYHWGEVKKGVYKDGHERPDVMNYRQEVFLKTYKELASVMPYPVRPENGYVDVYTPIVPEGQKLIIPVTHDECTCNANYGPHYQWVRGDNIPLRSKSRGQVINISEFVTPWGRLRVDKKNMSDEYLIKYSLHKREATEIIQCGGAI